MGAYIVRRLMQSVVVILGVIVITFLISRVLGDPVVLLLSPEATEEQRVTMTRDLGLDKPLYVQLAVYVSKVVRGDFGRSFRFDEPVLGLVLKKFPATLYLTSVAALISIVIALPLGIISAIRRGSLFDKVGMAFAVLGQSIPNFWAGIMMILLFSVKWRLVPPSGYEGIRAVILPAFTLALFFAAATARMTRSNVLDELDSDYVRYARLKGVPERVVLMRHVMRNAFVNILNIVALQFGILLGGAVITEFIFSWPGIGRLSIDAIYGRDYPVIQATVLLTSFCFVVINFAVDVIYMVSDPRVKRG
ncbi:MAG: ABC transporter permease [Deltaproteobacteria bacterium]|nr:ABC transporter permease [Deltaproteobacteria bacterium]